VQQSGDCACLQDRHVADHPRRAIAHHDSDALSLRDSPRREAMGEPFGNAVEISERQPLVSGDQRLGRGIQRAEAAEEGGQGCGEFGYDGAALFVVGELDLAAGPGHLRQFLVETPVELAWHYVPTLLCLWACPPYEALNFDGEALASRA